MVTRPIGSSSGLSILIDLGVRSRWQDCPAVLLIGTSDTSFTSAMDFTTAWEGYLSTGRHCLPSPPAPPDCFHMPDATPSFTTVATRDHATSPGRHLELQQHLPKSTPVSSTQTSLACLCQVCALSQAQCVVARLAWGDQDRGPEVGENHLKPPITSLIRYNSFYIFIWGFHDTPLSDSRQARVVHRTWW